MEWIFEYIETHQGRFVQELLPLLAQPSSSARGEGLEECAHLLAGLMEASGIEVRLLKTGGPPVVFGEVPVAAARRTLLIYGHYDVQPPEPLELWDTPPFQPTIRGGRIFARGAGDNKGQLFAHVKAVEAWLKVEGSLPVQVKFLFEGEEETGSRHLAAFAEAHRELLKADLVFGADGSGHPSGRPFAFFGCRGLLYLELRARGAKRDVHSGNYGGVVPNPIWTLVHALDSLRDREGKVLIEGFCDAVRAPTPLERALLAEISFDEEAVLKDLGLKGFEGGEVSYFEKLLFQPTVNISGLAGGYGGEGVKTIIPKEAKAKIDIRLVPDQDPQDIFQKVCNHLRRHGFEDVQVECLGAVPPSKTPVDHPYSPSIVKAVEQGFGEKPVLLPHLGGTLPDSVFTRILHLPSFWATYAQWDEQNHAPNENLQIETFVKAIRSTAALFAGLA